MISAVTIAFMATAEQPVRIRPPLTRRIKFGLGASVLSLVILVYPGMMTLPLTILIPLMPPVHGCANFGAPLLFLAFFVLAFILSGVLLVFGIATVILAAFRYRVGLVGAVLFNAMVGSLLLTAPLDFSASTDPGGFSLYVFLAILALIPVAALGLLLSPTVFRSWWRSSKPLMVAAVAAGLLLLPGAVGVVALGFQARDLYLPHPAAPQPAVSNPSRAAC